MILLLGLCAAAPWTAQDRAKAVDDAAAAAGAAPTLAGRAAMTLQLAATLADAGDPARARALAVQTATMLQGKTDVTTLAQAERTIALLLKLGDAADAQSLVDGDTPPPIRARLLEMLGRQQVTAHDGPGLARTLGLIRAMPDQAGDAPAQNGAPARMPADDPRVGALAGIATELAARGDPAAAQAIAVTMPDGPARLRVLTQIAMGLCKSGPSAEGAKLARSIADAATRPAPGETSALRGGAALAAAATAACMDAGTASRILDAAPNTGMATDLAISLLDGANLARAADALAQAPDAADAHDLMAAARRAMRTGDRMAARRLALQAAAAAAHGKRRHDQTIILSDVFGLLMELGAYEEALAATQAAPPANRRSFTLDVLEAEANRHDTAAVGRIFPVTMAALQADTGSARDDMGDLALVLARNGYPDEARKALAAMGPPPAGAGDSDAAARDAQVQAALGDEAAALKTAAASGPMVVSGADAGPGPQAEALSAIAILLAGMDQLAGAWRAEALLEQDNQGVLQDVRDKTLAAIAAAQVRTGQKQAALATALRIRDGATRFAPLMALLAKN